MEKYISKDAIVAEIEARISDIEVSQKAGLIKKCDAEKKITLFKSVLSLLDTLEGRDVDLEKEFDNYTKDIFASDIQFEPFTQMYNCAKYFFELGLKAKQESNDEVKIGETQIYLEDDGGEAPYDGKQWLDLSCMEYEIPKALFKDGDNVEIFIRKVQKGEEV